MLNRSAMRVDAQHADAPECGLEDLVGAGQRARVRGRGLGRLGRPTGLDDDDRLGQRDLARGRQEGARVADRLHVDDDAGRVRVVAEVVDDVAPADVEHRAERDDRAEAHVLGRAPVEHGGEQRAALADEADRPGAAMPAAKVAFRPPIGFITPRQLGPTTRIPSRAPRPGPPLELRALRADLLEPGRDDDRRP